MVQAPPLIKKLFATDTYWKREMWFSPMACHWVYQIYSRARMYSEVINQPIMDSTFCCGLFVSFYLKFFVLFSVFLFVYLERTWSYKNEYDWNILYENFFKNYSKQKTEENIKAGKVQQWMLVDNREMRYWWKALPRKKRNPWKNYMDCRNKSIHSQSIVSVIKGEEWHIQG